MVGGLLARPRADPLSNLLGVPQREPVQLGHGLRCAPAASVAGKRPACRPGELGALAGGPQLVAGVGVDDLWVHALQSIRPPKPVNGAFASF